MLQNETLVDLLQDLCITSVPTSAIRFLDSADNKYARDLRMNVKSVLENSLFTKKENLLLAIATVAALQNSLLIDGLSAKATQEGASQSEIAEMIACASLLSTNNVLYRFRHFTKKEAYQAPAKLRMNIMMSPITGKVFFEIASIAISAVNGCELCISTHEKSILDAGGTESMVWEAIRIASVFTGLSKVIY